MMRLRWAVPALAAAALALYGGALGHPPVFDDDQLTDAFLRRYASPGLALEPRWLSHATFAWVRELAGKSWFWQRLANLLLHAAIAALLFAFLARLFALLVPGPASGERAQPHSSWIAFAGALLFLVHPAAVYGVAYLVQRSILLATFWGIASLWLFLEGLERGARRWLLASAAAYALAIYSKEHAVMLPAVALALALLVRAPSLKLARELALPFALYVLAALGLVLQLKWLIATPYERFAADAIRQLPDPGSPAGASNLYAASVVNQGFLFFRYLLLWLLPLPEWMSIDLRPAFPSRALAWPQIAGFAAWLAWPALGVALLARRERAGLAGFALLAPWLLALTEMATVRVQEPFVIYRSYLWMCLLPAALPLATARLNPARTLALFALATLALVAVSVERLASFSSNYALWDDAVRKIADPRAPYADRAWRNRGVAHYQAGRHAEALADFDRAFALDPRNPKNAFIRGALHLRTGQSALALADYDRVLALVPEHQPALARRCVALIQLGRHEEAVADCSKAAALDPRDASNHTSLGMAQALRGATADAERSYLRALELEPDAGVVHYQYGVLLRGLGRNEEARREFARACGEGVQSACAAARSMATRR
jgi:tetratricopeptide (TPR) repeat protein